MIHFSEAYNFCCILLSCEVAKLAKMDFSYVRTKADID